MRGVHRHVAIKLHAAGQPELVLGSAETGEHYITRSRDEYRDMLRRAAGGGQRQPVRRKSCR